MKTATLYGVIAALTFVLAIPGIAYAYPILPTPIGCQSNEPTPEVHPQYVLWSTNAIKIGGTNDAFTYSTNFDVKTGAQIPISHALIIDSYVNNSDKCERVAGHFRSQYDGENKLRLTEYDQNGVWAGDTYYYGVSAV